MAMVFGEVTPCLHLNMQVDRVMGFSKCVPQFFVAGLLYHHHTCTGECIVARGSSTLPEKIEPSEVSRPGHLMATWNSDGPCH